MLFQLLFLSLTSKPTLLFSTFWCWSRILKITFLSCQGACNASEGRRDLSLPVLPKYFLFPCIALPSFLYPNSFSFCNSSLIQSSVVFKFILLSQRYLCKPSFQRLSSSSEFLNVNNSNFFPLFSGSRGGKCFLQLLPLWCLFLTFHLLS